MTQPLVVHIGFHKTGTTWLQKAVFPYHPRLYPYVSDRVWDDPFLRCIVADSDREFDPERARTAYETGLQRSGPLPPDQVVVVSAERLSGHAASGGYDTFRIAGRLHAVVPEARVLIVVRSQIDMIESEYRQLVGEGYRGRISSLWSSDAWKRVQFDLGQYEYDTLVREYQRLFGSENVGVFTYEGVVADRNRYLARLASFFGVEPFELGPAAAELDVHPGLPNRGLGLLRSLNHFRRTELNPFPVVDIGVWWRGPIVVMARALPRRRHLIPGAKRKELAERYREPNDRLAKLVPTEDFGPFMAALSGSVR
jgi:Sulfotransferase family